MGDIGVPSGYTMVSTREMSWECQATQAHPVLWSSARVNDTQPNSAHHYHPTHPLRESFKPNVNPG